MDGRFCSASSFSLSGACVHPWSRLEPAEQYVLVCEATSPWTDLRPCTFRVSIVGAYLAKVGDRPTFFLFLAIINISLGLFSILAPQGVWITWFVILGQ